MMGPTEPIASGVIAYNGDSERGWNDPPTLSFSTITSSKKGPKLDLRKRVSHQEALTGRKVSSPLTQNPPNLYQQGNNLSNGLTNLTLSQQPLSQQVPSNMPPTSPCHSRHSSGTYTPPLLPDAKGYGMVPPQYPIPCYSVGQNNSQTQIPYGNMVQVPPTTNQSSIVAPPQLFSPVNAPLQSDPGIVHPLAQKAGTTAPTQLPVTTAPPSNLGKPLFSFPSSFNMVPISSALDTSHVRSNPVISPETSPQNVESASIDQIPSFQNPNLVTQGPMIFTPSPTSTDNGKSLPMNMVEKRSPILNKAYQNGNSPKLYTPPPLSNSGRNSPIVSPSHIPIMNRSSPVSNPTSTHSASSTPRSSTPENGHLSEHTSRHNSEDFDSQEGLKVTIEAIEETIIKCANILKAREVEDVKKKVGIMRQLWIDEKLSLPVQITMKLLSKVLLDGDTENAHKLHLKLMVDYVGEVKQWMVAIKRLISAVRSINNPVS